MIKQEIYPKTSRFISNSKTIITEKLDGSNLGIGKYNNRLYLFQRNTVFEENELEFYRQPLYRGLYGWFEENKEIIRESLLDNTIVFGEWMLMGHLKYDDSIGRFNLFAKAKITLDSNNVFELSHFNTDVTLLHFPFLESKIPSIFNLVPIVAIIEEKVTIEYLDTLYEDYCKKVNRSVEGFVIYDENNNQLTKYVRYKRGRFQRHFDRKEYE